MKILALSDIHENTRFINLVKENLEKQEFKPNIVVVAGDITRFKGVETARTVLTALKDAIRAQVLFVPGNCDSPQLLRTLELGEGIINIHARAHRVDEYVFYGVGGGGLSPFYTPIEFSEEEFEHFISGALQYIGEKLIIVTHEPILGYFDDVNGSRIGSQVFAMYLDRLKPLVWITGHVHEKSGWTKVGETVVVHPGPFMKGFYALVEVSGKNVMVKIERIR